MKTFTFQVDPLTDEEFLEVHVRGRQLLNDPHLNKGSAFTADAARRPARMASASARSSSAESNPARVISAA